MPIKLPSNNLYVFMNGIRVGTLTRQSSGELVFTYEQSWLQLNNARPISLSLPLSKTSLRGEVVSNFFDNLLPDNVLIRNRIQARFKSKTNKCYDLLSHIGRDCVGALQLLTQPEAIDIKQIQADPIDDKSIAILLKGYQSAPLGMASDSDFRISIAGAQEKTALLWHKEKWHLPTSTTPTSHIIKLPIGRIEHAGIDLSESVENEWLCLQILGAYGLTVNHAEIKCFEDMKTLVVKRFDRRWSKDGKWLVRLPQEDMCQVLGAPSSLKYESDGGPGIKEIMDILRGSTDAINDREQFMKSVFLFWVLGAIDGHAKNFSISIEAGGQYKLTPIYDVMSAYPLAAKRQLEWNDLKMAMSLKSKNRHYRWHNIQLRHWISMATLCQFPALSMQTIIEEVHDRMASVISEVENQLPREFPSHISESIFSGMKKIKGKLSTITNLT